MNAIPSAAPEDGQYDPLRPFGVAALPTLDLLAAVVASGYIGHPWDELTRRLDGRARPDLEQAIRMGTIYRRCRRHGYPIAVRRELQQWPLCEDIAAEAVEECMLRFKTVVLPAGEWNPNRDRSLEQFFTDCCLADLANRWRFHLRQQRVQAMDLEALDESGSTGVLALMAQTLTDPEDLAVVRDQLEQLTSSMKREDRVAFELEARGCSRAEIADELGVKRNTLDARIIRAQKAARARRTS